MLLFVDHIRRKADYCPLIEQGCGGPSKLYERSRGLIQGAIDAPVKRAIKSGDVRFLAIGKNICNRRQSPIIYLFGDTLRFI